MQALYKLLGIKGAPSTAYHPQTDGMNEQSHQETKQYLAAFTNYHQDDWSDWLDIAEFVQNDHEHTATKQTPSTWFMDDILGKELTQEIC